MISISNFMTIAAYIPSVCFQKQILMIMRRRLLKTRIVEQEEHHDS